MHRRGEVVIGGEVAVESGKRERREFPSSLGLHRLLVITVGILLPTDDVIDVESAQ